MDSSSEVSVDLKRSMVTLIAADPNIWGLLWKTPNRTDNGLLGETYAHFKDHLYAPLIPYILIYMKKKGVI